MYFADLSPCRYYGLSVGWLEKGHDFPRGTVSDAFLKRLLERCRRPTIRHRGPHCCDFCPSLQEARAACVQELPDGQRVSLGSGVIRVNPRHGVAFVAPTLVYHYIQAHQYLPPQGFIEAVIEDHPENAETVAERYRTGAQYLSRMALGWMTMTAMKRSPGPRSKSPDNESAS